MLEERGILQVEIGGGRDQQAIPLAAGCWGSAQPVLKGRFDARWTGPDTGQVSAPGTAEWCSEGRLLEIRAVHGDTAIAMVLYPLDTVQADTYRIMPPSGADSLAPSAAVRTMSPWFSGRTSSRIRRNRLRSSSDSRLEMP